MRPHAGLGQAVGAEPVHGRGQLLRGIEDVAGEFLEAMGEFGIDAQMPEFQLDVGPGEFEGAVAGFGGAVLGDEPEEFGAACGGGTHERDLSV